MIGIDFNGNVMYSPKKQASKKEDKTYAFLHFQEGLIEITETYNISSITDLGSHKFYLNFLQEYEDSNYFCQLKNEINCGFQVFDKKNTGVGIEFTKEIPAIFKLVINKAKPA